MFKSLVHAYVRMLRTYACDLYVRVVLLGCVLTYIQNRLF